MTDRPLVDGVLKIQDGHHKTQNTRDKGAYVAGGIVGVLAAEPPEASGEAARNFSRGFAARLSAPPPILYRQLSRLKVGWKGGKFLKKLWCCFGGSIAR